MSSLVSFIPRPLRDIIEGPFKVDASQGSLQPAENMIKGAARIAIAAAGVFALAKFGGSAAVALALGAGVSFPATATVIGGWLLAKGVTATLGAVTAGSFAKLLLGSTVAYGGFRLLENYDFAEGIGLLERPIQEIGRSVGQWLGTMIS